MTTLDLTNEKAQDFEQLYHAIVDGVLSTQLFVVRPFPDTLLVTPDQFDILKPSDEFEPQDSLLWKTIHPRSKEIINIMDVHVKGVYEPKKNMLLLG